LFAAIALGAVLASLVLPDGDAHPAPPAEPAVERAR
jgi:hypothetical protein